MTRLMLLSNAIVLLSGAAGAAIPPQYQRPKEIRAILGDATAIKAFGPAHPIDKIERLEPARYRVTSGVCAMDVMLVDDSAVTHPPKRFGTWAFVVRAGTLTCR